MITEKDGLVSPAEAVNSGEYSMVGINGDGGLVLRHTSAEWALQNDIRGAISFEPFLIVDGEPVIEHGTGGWGIAPRTAVGQRMTGEFVFLVIDGRQIGYSIGADLIELQEILLSEKCVQAVNLDGGSSSSMGIMEGDWYRNLNRPSLGSERMINSCFIILPELNQRS